MHYEPLPTGTHGLTPDAVASDQRERLRRAIVELIAAKGYPAVRIADLSRLSRVSQPTFYTLFEGKEDLLVSAYTDIAMRTRALVEEAFAAPGDWRDPLRHAMTTFAELATAEPDAVSLLVLGALGAGPRALEERRRTTQVLELRMGELRARAAGEQTTAGDPNAHPDATDMTTKAIVGGLREVAASRLFHRRQHELALVVEDIVAWANAYPVVLPDGLAIPPHARGLPRSRVRPATAPTPSRAARAERGPPRARNRVPQSMVRDSQRARIVDATAAIVAERGLVGLTVPEIARRAGISHQTFYAMYRSKNDAFTGAQKVGLHQALQVAGQAWEARMPDWPCAIAAGLRALIDYLVSEPQHAHLTIVDTFGASPETIEARERALAGFGAFFSARHRGDHASAPDAGEPALEHPAEPAVEPLGGEVPPRRDGRITARAEPATPVAVEAVVGGCWQVLHHYVEGGRVAELPAAAPQLVFLLLAPFIGSQEAARVAREERASVHA